MTTLADQSAIVDFPWPVWVALALLTLGILAAAELNNAPLCDPEPSTLDQRDGVGCHRGHYFQLDQAKTTWVCATCGERVAREVAS